MRRIEIATRRFGALVLAATAAVVMTAIAVPRAEQQPPPQQQEPPQGRGGGRGGQAGAPQGRGEGRGAPPAAPGTPTKALVPVAASSLAATPDKYVGEFVTMTGTVEQSLARTAFSVDQDKTKTTGKEILVLAIRLNDPVEVNTYVTVIGEVMKFEPADVTAKNKNIAVDLSPDLVAKYRGKPVVLATAVINSSMIDLAKFNPPPMTAEEAAFDKTMKAVSAANGALRKGMDASNAELVKTNTDVLKKSFADTEAFWKSRGKADAMKFAQEARKAVDLIELAASAAKWDDVKTHVNTLAQQCSGCHAIYRERGDDGSFYIKPGSR